MAFQVQPPSPAPALTANYPRPTRSTQRLVEVGGDPPCILALFPFYLVLPFT